jgi:hypothetical protein
MVGTPHFPSDVDERDDLRGAARATPGLTALDEEREASMADEGGWSGAVMESEDPAAPYTEGFLCPSVPDELAYHRRWTRARVLGAIALGCALVGVILLARKKG